jgi:hypothetical protein
MKLNGRSAAKTGDIYAGFDPLSKIMLNYWEKNVISYGEKVNFSRVIKNLNKNLFSSNVILFFDHHYAFDALPLGVAIGNHVNPIGDIIIPYAVHLDMGLGREGENSARYWLRTLAFHWFVKHIMKGNPQIHFFPIVREFELETPRLREEVVKKFEGINTAYLRTFIRKFAENTNGQVCFLTPFSGIGFPDKPVLHRQLFRSIQMVMEKTQHKILFYITGAYPNWDAYQNYLAPLFMKHKVLIRGPFDMPGDDFVIAGKVVEKELGELRKTAGFMPPDYSKLLMK